VAQQSVTIQTKNRELESERKARQEAEKNAAAAVASLREIAQVKEESRGTVITLDGAVLFVTGKSELMPLARQKLDEVAKAMQDLDDKQTIVVEGHTDSKGNDDANMVLSQARAESVRSYLVSRGVKAERISAVGRGEAQPVASNDTPEGRANNRRVEIVISPRQGAPASR
jgi:outer membrane protein OmpA-like peptidoglycan-associated protein